MELVEHGARAGLPDGEPLTGIRTAFTEFCLDGIDPRDEFEHRRDMCGVVVFGFDEFSPDMREARRSYDIVLVRKPRGVAAEPVGLHEAFEVFSGDFVDEDVVQTGSRPAVVPIVEHSGFRVVVYPQVAGFGFAMTGFEVVDGRFVDLQVAAVAKLCGEQFVKGFEHSGEMTMPVAHEGAGDFDAIGGSEFPLLALEGHVVAVFFAQDVRCQRRAQHTVFEQGRGQCGGIRCDLRIEFADVGGAHDALTVVACGTYFEPLADFLADAPERFRVFLDFVGLDDFLKAGQGFDGLAQAALALPSGFFGLVLLLLISRRDVLVAFGGVGLFCLFGIEQQLELRSVELFALAPVELLDEVVDLMLEQRDTLFLRGVLLTQRSDDRILVLVALTQGAILLSIQ